MDSSSYTNGPSRPRHDNNALLMLPAPLSANRGLMASTPSIGAQRSSEEAYSDNGSSSNQRLIGSPQTPDHYSESFDSTSTAGGNRSMLSASGYEAIPRAYTGDGQRQRAPSPAMNNNPFRSMTTSPASEEYGSGPSGGVRLTDDGPVPGPDGVRRVQRPAGRRPTSQATTPTNRYSRNSTMFSLPPGAAPPSTNVGGYP